MRAILLYLRESAMLSTGLAVMVLILLSALAGPVFVDTDAAQPLSATPRLAPPVQHPFGTENEHAVFINKRCAARSVAVAVQILVIGRVREGPQKIPCFAPQASQAGFFVDAVKLQQSSAGDRGHRVTLTERKPP